MPFKVLVVDDSNFFQRRLKEIIGEHPELEVIGVATNGREAVQMAAELTPDIISMDYEMPVLNGVSAVQQIMANRPVPILMFSSMTYEGARITLDALEAGAVDFIPKDFAEVSNNSAALKRKLHDRLLSIARQHRSPVTSIPPPVVKPVVEEERTEKEPTVAERVPIEPSSTLPKKSVASFTGLKNTTDVLLIGASTGGPVAISEVLQQLPENFPLPILLIQHMPENFTKAFAERLNRQCNISVKEAENGDRMEPGLALLAPGGKQMMVDPTQRSVIKILPADERVNYRPSVDITFGSAAKAYGSRSLAVVLTGMGADGCDGARLLKKNGATVWSQDEASSVIYGMPMAVAKAGVTDWVLPLKDIAPSLNAIF